MPLVTANDFVKCCTMKATSLKILTVTDFLFFLSKVKYLTSGEKYKESGVRTCI